LFAVESLSAFFIEALFLGIMIFGWRKVHPLLHLFATFFVLVGVHYSAFWIIVINSIMHTPSGVELIDGILHVTSWKEIKFNPSMPYMLTHMLVASYMLVASLRF
jgi:cytochrome bd ubiquinol oxidase subunit I